MKDLTNYSGPESAPFQILRHARSSWLGSPWSPPTAAPTPPPGLVVPYLLSSSNLATLVQGSLTCFTQLGPRSGSDKRQSQLLDNGPRHFPDTLPQVVSHSQCWGNRREGIVQPQSSRDAIEEFFTIFRRRITGRTGKGSLAARAKDPSPQQQSA
jgi:hypothetical protein